MNKYGLIGEKLGHSFSKIIHNKLFGYDYFLKELPRDKLGEFMQTKDFDAVNVTIPYKQEVIPYLDEISDIALDIGAVNTIINRNGRLYGYNTDFSGMCALVNKCGISLTDKKVAVLGTGGTAKTANAVAKYFRAGQILTVSRQKSDSSITYDELYAEHTDIDIIINTTPCGMYPQIGESAVNISEFSCLSGVIDAVYNPIRTKLVYDSLKAGILSVGGLYMLVAQAAAAAEKFVGESVSLEKIDDIYRELIFQKENIVLTGMPGSGKTTVGRALAKEFSKQFIDTDDEIIKTTGKTIPEIFSEVGEVGFRNIEAEIIKAVSAVQGAVIATGGGAVLRADNIDLLKENGRVIFLDRPLDKLIPTEDRPLSMDRAALEKRYTERYSIYSNNCDIHLHCSELTEENIEMIKKELGL